MRRRPRKVDVYPKVTPQQMAPESWLGALLSRKPRYAGLSPDEARTWLRGER